MSNPEKQVRQMRPGVLRALLVALVLVVQIVTVLLVSGSMQAQTAAQFERNARTELALLADTVTERARLYLAPAENTVVKSANLIADELLDSTDDETLLRFFEAQLAVHPSIEGMFFGRPDGSALLFGRRADGLRSTIIAMRNGQRETTIRHRAVDGQDVSEWRDPSLQYDPRERFWYREAIASNAPIWTNVYPFWSSRVPGISAAVAIHDADDRLLGVLGVDVRIDELSAYLADIPNAATGTAAILDEKLNAVAFSDLQRLQVHLDNERMPSLDQVADRPLHALFGIVDSMTAPPEELTDGFTRLQVDGVEHLGLMRPISLADGKMNWVMLVQVPADEYSGGIRQQIRDKVRLVLLSVLLPGLFAIAVIYRLTQSVYSMHRDATIDHLTGALGRSEFERQLAESVDGRRDSDRQSKLILMALDLDGFKRVNDRHGHKVGDEVLRIVVERLCRRVRHTDLVGRIGGDEFVVAMRIDAAIDPVEMARKVRASVTRKPFETSAGEQYVGMTAGVATLESGESWQSLIERADHALVTGKTIGKNRCYVARVPTQAPDMNRPHVESRGSVTAATTPGAGTTVGADGSGADPTSGPQEATVRDRDILRRAREQKGESGSEPETASKTGRESETRSEPVA